MRKNPEQKAKCYVFFHKLKHRVFKNHFTEEQIFFFSTRNVRIVFDKAVIAVTFQNKVYTNLFLLFFFLNLLSNGLLRCCSLHWCYLFSYQRPLQLMSHVFWYLCFYFDFSLL